MGNTYTNVAVHIIFHTKNGCPKIAESDLPQLFQYIGGVIKTMSGVAYIVGGRPDHVHVLTLLPSSISLADFVRTIKANSSRRIIDLAKKHNCAIITAHGTDTAKTKPQTPID